MTKDYVLALKKLNAWNVDQAEKELFKCCSSRAWSNEMAKKRPFQNCENLEKVADLTWASLQKNDWLEAFSHHPQIGADVEKLREKFHSTKEWSGQEQKGVAGASETVLHELAKLNKDYMTKFGFVFLICATGKTAEEMLHALKTRISNTLNAELQNAQLEQSKITKIRLRKMLELL